MVVLSMQDLRAVTAFAAECAESALEIFETDQPDDVRPPECDQYCVGFRPGRCAGEGAA